jgi:hypothetical protein
MGRDGWGALALAAALALAGCSASTGLEAALEDPVGGGSGASAPLIVSPEGVIDFSAEGGSILYGGPVVLTLGNPGTADLQWSAACDAGWVSLSKTGGSLGPGGEDTLQVSLDAAGLIGLAPGMHEALVQFSDQAGGDTDRLVRLEWAPSQAPLLTLDPLSPFTPAGLQGGPFAPSQQVYTIRNVGEVPAGWSLTAQGSWLSVAGASEGTLAPGTQVAVTVAVEAAQAALLGVGEHGATLLFENTSSGQTLPLPAVLTVGAQPGHLTVLGGPLSFQAQLEGPLGGPQNITLQNSGGQSLTWNASSNAPWLALTPAGGSLAPGAQAQVGVALAPGPVGALAPGMHAAALGFDPGNGTGGGDLAVVLELASAPQAQLTVGPAGPAQFNGFPGGSASPAYAQYTVSNSGNAPLSWSASPSAPWIGLSSTGGTLAPGGQTQLSLTVLPGETGPLGPGSHQGSVQLANLSGGPGSTQIPVQLGLGSESSLATNLAYVAYWAAEIKWVDLFRMSAPWLPQEANGWTWNTGQPIDLDSYGWVNSLAPGQAAGTLMARDIKGHYPGGLYTLLFDGKGTFSFHLDAQVVKVEPGRIEVQVTPTNAGIHMKLTGTDPADPVRNIRFVMPGHEQTYETQPWYPPFLEMLQPYQALRFMDMQETNDSPLVHWSERTTPQHATQMSSRGTALEHLIELCNRAQKDAWFCMPHEASDDYVVQFATMVRDQLDPNLKVYVEYSNEVWNGIFSQYHYAVQQSQALGLGGTTFESALRFYSRRSVEIFDLWSGVFGDQAHRLVRTLAGHSHNPWTGVVVMDWQNAYQKSDAYAIAPYFAGSLGGPGMQAQVAAMTVDEILDYCEADLPAQLAHVANNAQNTQNRGLQLLAYEGGQHLSGHGGVENNDAITAKFLAANRDPRMHDIYLSYLEGWKNAGGGLFFHFNSVETYSKWGSWGALETLGGDWAAAPKYSALVEFAANHSPWW